MPLVVVDQQNPAQNQAPVVGEPKSFYSKWRYRFSEASWWHYSYFIDYVLIVILFVLGQVVAAKLPPYHRYIPTNDPSISYPNKKDIIPNWAMLVLANLGPIAIFAFYQIWGRSLHDFHHSCLGILEGLGFTVFFTGFIKIFAGELRPNYLSHGDSKDERGSFPSGHASVMFQGMTFLSLWMCGKFGLFKKAGGHVWQQFIIFVPLIAAGLVALTRIRDYHHNFVDITAGAVLGAAIAVINYFLKYPPLWKKRCEIPKRRWYEPHKSPKEWAEVYRAEDKRQQELQVIQQATV